MKELKIVTDKSECDWGYEVEKGRIIVICDKGGEFLLPWDKKFNLKTGTVFESDDELDRYDERRVITLNILAGNGIGREVHCYDEYDINLGWIKTLPKKKIAEIRKEFAENGFNVTEEAIMHNYKCWKGDFKSGYRDDENGYHLFTPCGHNPFSLSATTLVKGLDWQTTYAC